MTPLSAQAQANGPVSGRPPKSAGSSSSKDHQHISHAAAQQAAEPSSSPDAQPGSSSRAHVLPVGNSSSSVFQGNASSMVNSQVESVGLISSAFTQGPPISHAAAHQAAKPSQSLEGWPSSLVSTANVGSDADGASDSDQAATLHAVEPVVRQDDQSGTTTTAEVTMEAFHRLKASQGSKASPGLMTSPDSRQPAGKQHGMKKRFKPLPVQVCADSAMLAAVLEEAVHNVTVVLTPNIASCALRMHAAWTFALRPSFVPCKLWQQLTAASAVM